MSSQVPPPGPTRLTRSHLVDEDLAARSSAPVLITAATADSAETVARRIHQTSRRAARPFVRTCAHALPVSWIALRRLCSGVLDDAAGGTLLLSDVEETPRIAQNWLIVVLEELEQERCRLASVRLVSGTTIPLFERVHAGTFSARFFYRLNVIHVIARPHS